MNLGRNELSDKLMKDCGFGAIESRNVVDGVLDVISKTLAEGDPVVLRGFGKFRVLSKPDRMGRNPKTGKPKHIRARSVVAFIASGKLKGAVNESS